MSKVLVNEASLAGIADAIRGKNGAETHYKPYEMAEAISALPTGGGADNSTLVGLLDGTITAIEIPSTIVNIREYAFYKCVFLNALTLAAGIKTIENQAFRYCSKLKKLNFPESLSRIGSYTFHSSGLEEVTFCSTPEINTTSFGNCPELTVIRVPWAEGEVANAPWGATNATIIYNHTPEVTD